MSYTIKINRDTHTILATLAKQKNQSLTATLDEAVRDLQKKIFWGDFNESVLKLQQDPEAWAEYKKELEDWAL